MEKYYYILGLEVGCSPEQVKRAYRLLARVCHPDVHAHDPELQKTANILFGRIKEAHDSVAQKGGNSTSNESARKPPPPNSKAGERKQKNTTSRNVHTSRTPGPVNSTTPNGAYKAGGDIHFLLGVTKLFPESGNRMPAWASVQYYALQLSNQFHAMSDTYCNLKINKFDLIIFKYILSQKDFGFAAVFRCYEGKFWYTTNDASRRWQNLPLAYLVSEVWSTGAANIIVDLVRPNLDTEDDRQVDYRFRIQEIASSDSYGSTYDSNTGCPACGSRKWDGTSCPSCNFYLY